MPSLLVAAETVPQELPVVRREPLDPVDLLLGAKAQEEGLSKCIEKMTSSACGGAYVCNWLLVRK